MATLTMNITPDGAEPQHKAKGAPDPNDPGHNLGNAAYLSQSDALKLEINNFDAGSEIAEVHVYSDATETNEIGSWTRAGGASPSLTNIFNVSTTGSANVTLSDAENPTASIDRWYKVKVTSGAKYWWMDPEVINKAGGKNTGATWGPSTSS